MKFKKIMLVTLLLLAILTIGVASAADDGAMEAVGVEQTADDVVDLEANDASNNLMLKMWMMKWFHHHRKILLVMKIMELLLN